ncbi:MAG: hypothetical protein J5613_01410, partial [Alphaproteobacteria bacterium]|nr:hypothetical protein [Alphaproteobacteria bacterium]
MRKSTRFYAILTVFVTPYFAFADSTVTSKGYVDATFISGIGTGTSDGTISVTQNGSTSDITVKNVQTTGNLVQNATGLSSSSTDTTYPSAKLVYESIKDLDENVIESVQVNGTALNITNKAVNITNMTGATSSVAGTAGLVPAPAAGDEAKFLRGDGTWGTAAANPTVSSSDTGTGGYVVNSVAMDTTNPSQINVTRGYIKVPVSTGAPSSNNT